MERFRSVYERRGAVLTVVGTAARAVAATVVATVAGTAIYAVPATAVGVAAAAEPAGSAEPTAGAGAATLRPYALTEKREPCDDYQPLRKPLFGDLHVHTAFSQDASTQGTRNTPHDAYRFARGERLGVQPYDESGTALRNLTLARPLDFAAVTDHAEMLGEVEICTDPAAPGHDSFVCRLYRNWPRAAYFIMNYRAAATEYPERFGFCGADGELCREASLGPWSVIAEAAEAAYDRSSACSFTTFVGYEWTGSPSSNNLHRNVLFRNEKAIRLPISHFDAPTPQSLWNQLDGQCGEEEGCEVLTIPHNSNLSGGLMFQTVNPDGSAIDAADARERARFEPLVEIMQHKGASECLFGAGNEDELCGFEELPYGNFVGKYVSFLGEEPDPSGFVRNVLEEGLLQESKLGANPFKFGLVASTDTHLGTPGAVREDEFLGHGGAGVPAAEEIPPGLPDNLEFNPGGLAVLWAEENTRDSLFAAMQRREAYATSGPRIVVRFFGGWELDSDLCTSPDFVARGYDGGVPMGADLRTAPAGAPVKAPAFAVWALRDAGTDELPGTGLERIQIVKGWVDEGTVHENVYDVAGTPGGDATVDPRTCATTSPASEPGLCTVWTDPDFDRGQSAFYYARVIENPTCRWSARMCVAAGVDCQDPATIGEGLEPCCAPDHRWVIQERAWTSPIWYTPRPRGGTTP